MNDKSSGKGRELEKPIAIYYEHPDWFRPLFQQLDERGARWVKVDVRDHHYDAASAQQDYSLLFNRMSPSAWQRGLGHAIFYTVNYLEHLEAQGVRVVNGSRCFRHEISKALQLTNLEKLGLPYPKARVINHPSQTFEAAEAIGYPVVIKPNIGGSGAGIERFNSAAELRAAALENRTPRSASRTFRRRSRSTGGKSKDVRRAPSGPGLSGSNFPESSPPASGLQGRMASP